MDYWRAKLGYFFVGTWDWQFDLGAMKWGRVRIGELRSGTWDSGAYHIRSLLSGGGIRENFVEGIKARVDGMRLLGRFGFVHELSVGGFRGTFYHRMGNCFFNRETCRVIFLFVFLGGWH